MASVKDIPGKPKNTGVKELGDKTSPVLSDDRRLSRQRGFGKNDYIVVSFYTDNYADIVKDLISSLKKFNLPYEIDRAEDKGGWWENTSMKPAFIKQKLEKHKKCVVWLDADAIVKRYPFYFDFIEEDVAFYDENIYTPSRDTVKSGTVFLRYTPVVLRMVDAWVNRTRIYPNNWEQAHLRSAVRSFYQEAKIMSVHYLPDSYCYMDGITKVGNPVIYHKQANRLFRRF